MKAKIRKLDEMAKFSYLCKFNWITYEYAKYYIVVFYFIHGIAFFCDVADVAPLVRQ